MACGGGPTHPAPVSIAGSRPVSPANGALLLDEPNGGSQNIELVATPAVTTSDSPITYTFDVSATRDFTQILFTRRVTPAAGVAPTTSFRANIVIHDYFWRVQASAGDVAGPMSEVFTFNVGFGISIGAPTIVSPDHGSLETVHPRLIVARAPHTGTVRTMIYRFEVSTTPSFDRTAWRVDVGDYYPEQPPAAGPDSDLETGTTYYWRVRAYDARTNVSGPYSSTAMFVTRTVALQPPVPVSPASNEPTSLRPTLTVRNAPRVGPIGAMTYRFDLAADAFFATMLVSSTVAETPAQTSLVVASDLPAEAVIHWRATATDTASGISSTSPPRIFVTHAAHSDLYTLVLHLPDECGASFKREFTFDGHLTARGNAIGFTVPSIPSNFGGELRLNFLQNGSQLAGTLATNASPDRDGFYVSTYERSTNHAPVFVTGAAAANGRWTGVFDGFMHVLHPSFGLATVACVAPHYTWSLAPAIN